MSRPTSDTTSSDEQPADQDFPYGWRLAKKVGADGRVDFDYIPLTLEDVLHPEEEDVIPLRPRHEIDCVQLVVVFRSRDIGPPKGWVTGDLRIDWGVEGIRPHSPDIAVFVGLREEPNLDEGTFHLANSGGRCVLALEVVSPDTRVNDVDRKFDHYYRIGIPLYVLVDQEHLDGPRRLVGYRWTVKGYESLPLDDQGRLFLEPVRIYLGLRDNLVVCWDADTGEELSDPAATYRELAQADRTIEEQAEQLEQVILQARVDAQARAEAERQIREETQARLLAEKANQAAQERIRQLEALLAQSRGNSSTEPQ
jgi:colicin import membrane protein